MVEKVSHVLIFARLILLDSEGKKVDHGVHAFLIDLEEAHSSDENVDDADSDSDGAKKARRIDLNLSLIHI